MHTFVLLTFASAVQAWGEDPMETLCLHQEKLCFVRGCECERSSGRVS